MEMPLEITIAEIGMIMVILGFIILFLALIYLSGRGADYGGVVLIGPIPIVFGSWKFLRRYWWILSILGVILLILFLLPLLFSFQDLIAERVM